LGVAVSVTPLTAPGGAGIPAYGLLIHNVAPGSPAARAGLEAGDILVQANQHRLDSPQNLSAAIQSAGGSLLLTVIDVRTQGIANLHVSLGSPGSYVELRAEPQTQYQPWRRP
jgi:S1-C subfamily serine protease